MIRITFTDTGETRDIAGKLMVASNGTIFVKDGSHTVFASHGALVIAEEV